MKQRFREENFFEGNFPEPRRRREGNRMTLSETLLLLTLLVAAAALIVDVAKAVFDITWKISHDRKNDDNKKD